MNRENVITHLQIIRTWASFARECDLQFFTAKHLEDIAQWADDALLLLKEQGEREKEMGKKSEMKFPAKEEQTVTVTGLLDEIVQEFCVDYCKYPDICESEKNDPDEAENLLYEKYCANCPMNKL